MNNKLVNTISDIKLKEHYDPNALHDLKDITDLDKVINELYSNRNKYLLTFIKSKFLSKDEIQINF